MTGFLLAFGVGHTVQGQVTSENGPLPQSANMRISPEYLQANADLQAQTREIVGPLEWSANDKQLIVKPALLVMPEKADQSFQVRLSSVPSGDVNVVVSVPTRLDGKLRLTTTSLSFTASNFDQFQKVSVDALPGSDTGDREEVLTLSASGGGYNSAEASVPIYVDQDVCARQSSAHWRSVKEGSSCVVTYGCGAPGGPGSYFYVFHVNGSATPGVDLIVNGVDSLEITHYAYGSRSARTTDQFVAPADGIPEGDETLGCFCRPSPNPPGRRSKGSQILVLDADGWAVGDTVAAESSGEMTFLLKFPMPVARDLTVRYETKDGSAIAGDDYDSRTGTVTVQKGDTSAEIRVPLIPDNIAEGVEEFKLVTWSDQFQGIGRQEATGRILEKPEILLQPSPLEVEEGSSAIYQARLYVEPSGEVMVAISGDAGTDLSLEGTTSLTFMPSDFGWKPVRVSIDRDADSNPDKVTLTHTASGASEYAGVTADLEVTILDRYAVELIVTPTVLALKENGSDPDNKEGFEVSLGSPPIGGEVKVAINVADALQNKVSLSESGPLIFDTSSWDTAQTITITAMDDSDANDEAGAVDLTASGAGYGGQKESVKVTVEDDEVTLLLVSPKKLSLTEDADPGKEKAFEARLNAAPAVPEVSVAVNVSTDLSGKATVDRSNLVYTSSNWSVDQTVTVTAVADADVADESGTVNLTATGGEFEGKTGSVAVEVKDDDVLGLRVSPTTLALKEDATHPDHAKDIRVRLQSAPVGGSVTVSASGSTSLAGKVSFSAALTFTSTDWNVEQSITVTALEDADVADESGTVELTASGAGYDGQSGSVTVTVEDDEVTELLVSPKKLSLTEDADPGKEKSFEVRLNAAPVVPEVSVAVTVSTDLSGKATVDRSNLVYTSSNWSVDQTVTVTAQADADGADESGTVNLTATGGEFEGKTGSVAVAISDPGTPALKFSDLTLTVDEGGSATYTVWLATEPSAKVSVAITSNNPDVTLDRKALTFGVGDWNLPQRITVSAREDDDALPDKALLPHKASGGGYEPVSGTIGVTVIENDTPGLTITPPAITVVEGERGTYGVALKTEPMSVVTVTIGSSNPDVNPAPSSLEFSAVNWGTEQQVTVSAARDSDVNDETATLMHTASGADYGGVTKDLVVTVRDPDVLVGLVVSPRSLTVTEGTEGRFSVKLLTRPTQAVTVQVTGGDGSGLRVDPGILRFTTDDWDSAVQIVVEAEEDDDGMDARVRLMLTASGAEYTGQEESVVVEIEDVDVARIVVVPQEFTVDEGGDKTYEVSLSTAPSAEVTVEIASDNPNVGLDRGVLIFTVNDWDEALEVPVSAFEDEDTVDDSARLTHTASGGDYEGLTAYVPVEVTDNDEVELRVSPQSLRLVEGASGKAFEIWLGAVPSGEVRVSVTETSTLNAKVSVSPRSLIFSPSTWESPQPVMVTALDDEDGSKETGEVRLEASGGGYSGESAEVQIGITDDDEPHRLDLIRPEELVTEGAGRARVEVRLNRESDAEVRVHYTTRGGTATEGVDYEHRNGIITFAPRGDLVQWIEVPIVDDRLHEEEESFRLVLSNAEGAELGNSVGTVTIQDDDLAPTFRMVPVVYVREGAVAQVHVSLSNASSQPVTASYRTEDVTATGGKDYRSEVAGALTIGAGDMEAVIEVATLDDAEHEGREALVVQLGDGVRIVVTILDNDTIPGLSVEDVTISEDGGRAKVEVTLDGASAVRVGVAYATQDGTATAGEDYTRAMGTLVFAPGEVKREVFIPVHQDEVMEEDETFRLRLSVPEHARLLDGEAIVTIVDDPLEVSIYDGTGAENAEELVLPVRLNYSSSQVVSAQFAVTGGTATPDVDFESTQGVVMFEPGSVEAQVRIPLKDDDLVEGDETVEVTLSDPRNAVLGQAQAAGTITDDETVPGVQVRARTPTAREAVFVITAAVGQVRYRTMDGTAWEGEDYERTEGLLEFGLGETVKEVRVPLLSGQGKGEVFALMVEVDGEAIRSEVVLGGRSDRRGRALLGRSMAQHVVEAVSERLQGGVVTCMPRPYPGQGMKASHMLSGCGMQASGERISVWGRGAYSRLSGAEVQGAEVVTASLGADYRLGSRWLMGVMVSRSEARESSLQLTGWYPYVRYGGQEHQVWGLAGAGQGEGTGMRLMAAGVAGRLARTRGMRLGYEADGFWLGMDREIGVRRLRAGLEGVGWC